MSYIGGSVGSNDFVVQNHLEAENIVSLIETWILQANAAEAPRHRFLVTSLDLMCHKSIDIDSCDECSCVL